MRMVAELSADRIVDQTATVVLLTLLVRRLARARACPSEGVALSSVQPPPAGERECVGALRQQFWRHAVAPWVGVRR